MSNILLPAGLKILYEDNHIIVVNKTVHDLVQKDRTGDEALDDKIKSYLKVKYNKPGNVFLGIVHRLDRPVSGLVVFARTSKALSRLNKMFRDNSVKKTYWAITISKPEKTSDTLVHYLKKNPGLNKSFAHNREVHGSKKAELDYHLRISSDNYHLLEINLKTGRHHQIRAQLASIGCIIKGDLKYGAPRSNKDGGISLHARHLCFTHPVTKEEINITAPVPDYDILWTYFENQLGS